LLGAQTIKYERIYMGNEYFVMLTTQDGGYTPMMQDDDDIAQYATEQEARENAEQNMLAQAFGYEVFRIGDGL
jgi:hypothetical protein